MAGDNLKLKGKIEEFYQGLIPILQKFPKTQRYTLAENIEKETLACVRLVFEAEYVKARRLEALKSLRLGLHVITFLLRVSHKSSFIRDGVYEQLTRETTEMGKIASGWIKSEESSAKKALRAASEEAPAQTRAAAVAREASSSAQASST